MARPKKQSAPQGPTENAIKLRKEKLYRDLAKYRASLYLDSNDDFKYTGLTVNQYLKLRWQEDVDAGVPPKSNLWDYGHLVPQENGNVYKCITIRSSMATIYRELGMHDLMTKSAKAVVMMMQTAQDRIKAINDLDQRYAMYNAMREVHITMAPFDFEMFLIALEWESAPSMKFYSPRAQSIRPWVKAMQSLENGELEVLTVSCPPRVGKSTTGVRWMLWSASRNPGKSILFVTHTSSLAKKFFTDVLNLITDERSHYADMFPALASGVTSSADDLWIDFPAADKTGYKTFYFRGIDGSLAGGVEASNAIYLDDVIKNLEEAQNPARLENAWQKVSVDVMQRKTHEHVKLLSIATKWSVHDPISRLQDEYENTAVPTKFIRVPALNGHDESNFQFTYNPLTTDHFRKMRSIMDTVSFATIYQQEDLERDGLVFSESNISYYNGVLPDFEPDLICAACDTAWGGGDRVAMPIGYVYGRDVYIHDAVHNQGTKKETQPLVVRKLIEHKVSKAFFEYNNGGEEYKDSIADQLEEQGYRCNLTGSRAPSVQSKLQRILSVVPEITAGYTDGRGYNLHFLSPKARLNKPEYDSFFKETMRFSQAGKKIGKQHDDAPDSLSMMICHCLLGRTVTARARLDMNRSAIGL